MKVSLITTVKNEADNIEEFLNSVINQKKKPQEFIIVDGGSTDDTFNVLEKYSKKYRWMKVFQIKDVSVGKGRNYAIEKSKNSIIAITDAGCVLHKNWLKEITKPFKEKNIDAVAGIYRPLYKNNFEYFQALQIVPKAKKIFMSSTRMSSRSFAIRKTVFQKHGGYPDFNTGEDTKFILKLKSSDVKFGFAKSAVVYWRMRRTWYALFKQFFNYGSGDKKSGNLFEMKKNILFIVGIWFYMIALLVSSAFNIKITEIVFGILILYLIYSGVKFSVIGKKINGFFYGILITIIRRFAYVFGATFG